MRFCVVTAVACLSLVGLASADSVHATVRRPTSIPAQELGAALQTLAKQRGFQIVFVSTDVERLRTEGASGELTSEEALNELLQGTGMTFQSLGDDGVSIVPISTAPVTSNNESISTAIPAASAPSVKDEQQADTMVASQGAPKGFWQRLRMAQADTSPSSATQSSTQREPAGEADGGLEEIVVTAQKREQRLIDVPLSLTVLSADEIERRGLVNSEDYLRGVPGVSQIGSGNGQSIVIRGIETSPYWQNFFSGATAATYFGETPTTNSAGLNGGTNVDLKLVDIERVEVLRGPQGTAFGSSSMGGAVRTIPVAPKLDRVEANLAAGYSVTSGTGGDNYTLQAVGNIPLIADRLAIRAVGYQYQDSGYYHNRAGSDPVFQSTVVVPYGVQAFARDEKEVGEYSVSGGRISALIQANDDLRFTLSYLSQKTQTDGIPVANDGTYDQAVLRVASQHTTRGKDLGRTDTDIDIANALMEYSFSRASLVATYSYTTSGSGLTYPFTSLGGFNFPWSNDNESDHREHVAEVRLVTRLDGPLNFLAGVYRENLDDEAAFDNIWYGSPATNFFGDDPAIGNRVDQRDLTQKAAFGEVSWQLLPALTLTGGVRAYDYKRRFELDTSGPAYGGTNHTNENVHASGENYRANLSYKPTDDSMVYAGWSQGFRLGQPQGQLPAGLCDRDADGLVDGTSITLESTGEVGSDDVDSYEIGGKLMALQRRLTVAADAFRMDWTGMPVTAHSGTELCRGLGYLANAGEARSEGVEFQANFQFTAAWRVDIGGSWIHARLTEDVPALGASRGDRLPGSPKINANLGLQYEFAVRGYKAFIRADSIYVSDFFGNLQETPSTRSGDYVKLDVAARVEIKNLNVELSVRNLTNEDAFTFRNTFGGAGDLFGYRLRPRTIGLRVGYKL